MCDRVIVIHAIHGLFVSGVSSLVDLVIIIGIGFSER